KQRQRGEAPKRASPRCLYGSRIRKSPLSDFPVSLSQSAAEITPAPNDAVDIFADRADARAFGRRSSLGEHPDLAALVAQLVSACPQRAEAVDHSAYDQNIFPAIARRVAVDLVDGGLLRAGRQEDGAGKKRQGGENTNFHFSPSRKTH